MWLRNATTRKQNLSAPNRFRRAQTCRASVNSCRSARWKNRNLVAADIPETCASMRRNAGLRCMHAPKRIARLADGLGLLACLALIAILAGCGGKQPSAQAPWLGNPKNGAVTITRMGCGSCHAIPGISGADGMVGPPLAHFSRRTIIAGLLPNTPDNLVRWVQHPQAVVPGNAMPDMGLSEAQARDVAAYLHTLK